MLAGNRWTVGGFDQQSPPDLCVRADWPRRSGTIIRQDADYFWQSWQQDDTSLIQPGNLLPTGGSAAMTLDCPSPLSNSATLSLRGPHRFDGHVDAAILVDQVLLMGPTPNCHIRTIENSDQIVLVARGRQWEAQLKGQQNDPPENLDSRQPLVPGERIRIGSLAMTLEPA
ncbi:hypothetical protein [Planctomycetes bacterium K23_9]|uniref:hypothetical protein n=1 Tax=Stieleria marina TaxID=1930275 RepID=UPI0011A9F869